MKPDRLLTSAREALQLCAAIMDDLSALVDPLLCCEGASEKRDESAHGIILGSHRAEFLAFFDTCDQMLHRVKKQLHYFIELISHDSGQLLVAHYPPDSLFLMTNGLHRLISSAPTCTNHTSFSRYKDNVSMLFESLDEVKKLSASLSLQENKFPEKERDDLHVRLIQSYWRQYWLKQMARRSYSLEQHHRFGFVGRSDQRWAAFIESFPIYLVHGTRATGLRSESFMSSPHARGNSALEVETCSVCFTIRFGEQDKNCPNFVRYTHFLLPPEVDLYIINWSRLSRHMQRSFMLTPHLSKLAPRGFGKKYRFTINAVVKVAVTVSYDAVHDQGMMVSVKQTTISIHGKSKTFSQSAGSLMDDRRGVVASVVQVFGDLLAMIELVLNNAELFSNFSEHLFAHRQHCYDILNQVLWVDHFEVRTAELVPIQKLIKDGSASLIVDQSRDDPMVTQEDVITDFCRRHTDVTSAMKQVNQQFLQSYLSTIQFSMHQKEILYQMAVMLFREFAEATKHGLDDYTIVAMLIHSRPEWLSQYGHAAHTLLQYRPDKPQQYACRLLCRDDWGSIKKQVDHCLNEISSLKNSVNWSEECLALLGRYAEQVIMFYHCRSPNSGINNPDIALLRVMYPHVVQFRISEYPSHYFSTVHKMFLDSPLSNEFSISGNTMLLYFDCFWKMLKKQGLSELHQKHFALSMAQKLLLFFMKHPRELAKMSFVKPFLPQLAVRFPELNEFLMPQPLPYKNNTMVWRNAVVIMVEYRGCFYMGEATVGGVKVLCFPGGTVDGSHQYGYATENDFYRAALREAHEEMGLDLAYFSPRQVGWYEHITNSRIKSMGAQVTHTTEMRRSIVYHCEINESTKSRLLSADDLKRARLVDARQIHLVREHWLALEQGHSTTNVNQRVRKSNVLLIQKFKNPNSPDNDALISAALHAEDVAFCSEQIKSHRMSRNKLEEQWLIATKNCLTRLSNAHNSYADFVMAVWLLEVVATVGAGAMAPYVYAEVCLSLSQDLIPRPYPNSKHCFNLRPQLYSSEGHRRYHTSRLYDSVGDQADIGGDQDRYLMVLR